MQIDSIDLYHVAMPLIYPWRTAYGEDAAIESVLVRMTSGKHVGWGEATPFAAPCYSPEWAGGIFACMQNWLAPALVGQWIQTGDDLQQRLAHFKGNPFAKAGLDTAWWVLKAVSENVPLYQLLGGTSSAIDVGADFGVMDDIGDLITGMRKAFDDGFPRVKLKFRPGWDLNMLRAVRNEFPEETIHIDCNSGYNIDAHLELFCRLDDFQLAMIEQPLNYDDVIDHARLQETISTPVCLDESINSVSRTEQALDLGSCRYVNIKPGRVGGLTVAIKIHDMCQAAGIPCWVGGMLESAVGASICIALGTKENFRYPADIFPSARFYTADLSGPEIELTRTSDGRPQAAPRNAPGIGVEPITERLEACCKQRATILPPK